jgi:hypothetical protein
VVRAALLDRSWQFWPTWRELEVACDTLASPRRALMAALERGHDWREEREPDEEERQRAQAISEAYLAEVRAADRQANPAERKPHWSETAAPDDPRWAQLRKAREPPPPTPWASSGLSGAAAGSASACRAGLDRGTSVPTPRSNLASANDL